MLALAAAALLTSPAPLHILFIGNSHTTVNDLPSMVQNLLESDGSHRKVVTKRYFEAFLNDGLTDRAAMMDVDDPRWDIVILQGAKASSSHKYKYHNDNCAAIARSARRAGSRALFFVEWPRRGWDESEFQMDIYRTIHKAAPGSELVPVCYAWDAILKKAPKMDLWAADGNHASPLGTYLAANVFYYYLEGTQRSPSWSLAGLDQRTNQLVRESAKAALERKPAKKSA